MDPSSNESQVLKRLDFPAYCIRMLENGLVALSGGGGTAKTGVANAIELGLVDYDLKDDADTAPILERLMGSGGKSPLRAHFETVHAYQPADAIMKFISFSLERPCKACKQKAAAAAAESKPGRQNESTTTGVRKSVYLVAAVNNWLEFYEVQPVSEKAASSDSAAGAVQETAGAVRQRKTSTAKAKKSSSSSQSSKIDSNNNKGLSSGSLKAGAQLRLVFRLDTVSGKSVDLVNRNDETFLPEPAPSEAAETVNAMVVSGKTSGGSLQLCVGTSKGAIVVFSLLFAFDELGQLQAVSAERAHANPAAHGGKEVDDLQVNESLLDPQPAAALTHLLSIGRDNKCCLWSLAPKDAAGRKLAEIDYTASLGGNSNLRMRHARYDALGRTFYATYIPRSRGGGSGGDTSSYVQRWALLKFKKPPGYLPASANDLVEFELNGGVVFNYKLLATRRVRNTIVTAMQCTRDGSQVCVGDYEGRVYLFDADLNALRLFKRQHTSVVTDLAFYYDSVRPHESSKLILSLSIDRTLQCYKNLTNATSSANSAAKSALLKAEPAFLDAKKSLAKSLVAKKSSSFSLLSTLIPKVFSFLAIFFLVFCYFFAHFE